VKILLTGGSGQIGWELRRTLAPLGEIVVPDRAALDLARPNSLATHIRELRPDVIINAAAYTDVEGAERATDQVMTVNATAPGVLAEEARRAGAQFIHFSTDYVFDGNKPSAYVEDDEPRPINAYGRSKLAGEHAVRQAGGDAMILRTSWIYSARGRNFLLAILRKAHRGEPLSVVADQTGSPTWARFVAEAVAAVTGRGLARKERYAGLYHVSCAGAATWHEFAEEILAAAGIQARVARITSDAYPSAARRPAYSLLDCSKFAREFSIMLPLWRTGVFFSVDDLKRDAWSAK
jgi:dTDP-4-dehydrorhamnose reductase